MVVFNYDDVIVEIGFDWFFGVGVWFEGDYGVGEGFYVGGGCGLVEIVVMFFVIWIK